jgi:hypothetical protein
MHADVVRHQRHNLPPSCDALTRWHDDKVKG